ncbi:MAG: SMC-Scp complex subunit ScpB [Beijerinckiaceae bacterium]
MAEAARIIEDEDVAVEGAQDDAMLEACRIVEALIFASTAPVEESELAKRLPEGLKLADVMQELRTHYEGRGFNLVRVAKKWTFRTAADLGWLLSRETTQQKKLSRAALETLAIVAYHQPVTRADVEEIRGVAISKGTLDVLIETGWVRLRGRRKTPGRPVTYGTTEEFLLQFGLEQITDLPGLDELKGAGLFDGRLPPGFGVPTPSDNADLAEDEDPLEDGDMFALIEQDEAAHLEAAALAQAEAEQSAEGSEAEDDDPEYRDAGAAEAVGISPDDSEMSGAPEAHLDDESALPEGAPASVLDTGDEVADESRVEAASGEPPEASEAGREG